MKTTYYIEATENKNIYAYYPKLKYAKHDLTSFEPNSAVIVCLKGPYYGEGYHAYKLSWNGKKIVKQKGV